MQPKVKRNRIFADLTRFMKRSPRARAYIAPIIAYIAVTYLIFRSVYFLVIFYILPFLIVIILDILFIRIARFHFPFRRVLFLNFSVFTVLSFLIWIFFPIGIPLKDSYAVVIFCWSAVSFIRGILYLPYYVESFPRLILPSMFPVLAVSALSLIFGRGEYYIVPSLVSSILFFTMGYLFVELSIREFKEVFGVSPIIVLNMFLNLKTEEDHEGLNFFRTIYSTKRVVPVKCIKIERDGKKPLVLAFPYVHPGPFGNFGSSNLPYKLVQRLSGKSADIMVFHTATTNSNNCRDDSDVDSIASALERAMDSATVKSGVSRFRKIVISGVSVGIQRFGGALLLAFIPDRHHFDDISFEECSMMSSRLMDGGRDDIIVVDAQSYFYHGAPALDNLDRYRNSILREYRKLQPGSDISAGYGHADLKTPGAGPMGVQVLVLGNERWKQCYVLTDSNNITTQLIERVKKSFNEQMGVEFFTTDNHVVNSSTLDMNPLGERDDETAVADVIIQAINSAIEDMSPAIFSEGSSEAEVHMGEENTFNKMNTTVFSAVRTAKYAIFGLTALSLLLSYLIFLLLYKFI